MSYDPKVENDFEVEFPCGCLAGIHSFAFSYIDAPTERDRPQDMYMEIRLGYPETLWQRLKFAFLYVFTDFHRRRDTVLIDHARAVKLRETLDRYLAIEAGHAATRHAADAKEFNDLVWQKTRIEERLRQLETERKMIADTDAKARAEHGVVG